MKKYILLYIGIILSLLASCQQEEPLVLSENNGKECTLSFKVNIPQSTTFSRNTFNDGKNITIDNLYLLVFDDNGILQAGYAAKKVTKNENNEDVISDYSATGVVQETQYDYQVTVVPRQEKTIIHFIANCPIALGTILNDMANKSESEIIQSLTTTESKTAYWQMMSLNHLEEDGSDDDKVVDDIPLVKLIRNFAAVQVKDMTGRNEDGSAKEGTFLQAYDLVNVPQSGTVAPYFGNAKEGFVDYLQTLTGTNTLYDELTANGFYGVEPASNTYAPNINALPNDISNNTELYLYERNHQGVDAMDITFLIVKGTYEGSPYYYRVDFAKNFEYLNILRNIRYVITIKSVTGKGYTSPRAAAKGNSVNNIDVAIEVEEITDGTHTLFVSPTAKTVLNGTENITINYETDEASVTCIAETVTETSGAFSNVVSNNDGTITVTMKKYMNEDDNSKLGSVPNGKQNQTFKVKTPSGLYREVKITLIDGFLFENVTFTRNSTTGNYEYSFTIPAGLEKSMFPLELFLFEETCSFSPVGDTMSVKLKDDDKNDGRQTWGYAATLDWEDYDATTGSTYTYEFVANSPITTDKTMTISNEYAKANGTATYIAPTAQISIEDNDATQDGVLSWNVDTDATSIDGVTSLGATITITDGYEYEVISKHSAFDVTDNKDGTLTIKPTLEGLKDPTGLSESLIVRTNENPNYNTASLTLQMVAPTTLNIVASNLRAQKAENVGGWNFSSVYNEKFTIYTDNSYTNYIGECTFTSKSQGGRPGSGNTYYELSEDLSLTIPAGVETLYFVYKGQNRTYYAEISVDALLNANSNNPATLNFYRKNN